MIALSREEHSINNKTVFNNINDEKKKINKY